MSFPSALRDLRVRKMMTQDDFARHIKVSRATIAAWEAGNRVPSMSMARKLVAAGVAKSTVLEAMSTPDSHEAA